jgi:Uma2 family endonuclease
MTARTPLPTGAFVIEDVDWETYEKIMEAFAERRIPHTYVDGTLELMTISHEHEWLKKMLGRFIETASMELEVRITSSGSATLRRQLRERGLEPDESYYVANYAAIRGVDRIDLDRDPPPDLVVEVDITSRSLDRLEAYARLGVTEIWRFDGSKLHFLRRASEAGYEPVETSLAFPQLRAADLQRFLDEPLSKDEYDIMRDYVAWLRTLKRG